VLLALDFESSILKDLRETPHVVSQYAPSAALVGSRLQRSAAEPDLVSVLLQTGKIRRNWIIHSILNNVM
jgi:hypothetical protein